MENIENNVFEQKKVMSTKDWFITLFITTIPLVGFIMLIVWAVGDDSNINRKNFAKASLLWIIIGIVLAAIFYATLFATLIAAIGSGAVH